MPVIACSNRSAEVAFAGSAELREMEVSGALLQAARMEEKVKAETGGSWGLLRECAAKPCSRGCVKAEGLGDLLWIDDWIGAEIVKTSVAMSAFTSEAQLRKTLA